MSSSSCSSPVTREPGTPAHARRWTLLRALERRSIVVTAAGIALASAIAVVGYRAIVDHDRADGELLAGAQLGRALDATLQRLLEEQSAGRAYAVVGDDARLAAFERRRSNLAVERARLHSVLDRFLGHKRHPIEDEIEQSRLLFETRMNAARGGELSALREGIASGEGERRMQKVRERAAELRLDLVRRSESASARAAAARDLALLAYGVFVIVVLALGAHTIWVTVQHLYECRRSRSVMDEVERRFRFVTESAFDLVAELSPRMGIRYISPSVERLIGYSPEEIVAAEDAGFLLELGDRSAIVAALHAAIESGLPTQPVTHTTICKDGTRRWLDTRFVPVLDEHGAVESIHATSLDVTDRQNSEIEMDRAMQLLEEASIHDELTGLLNRRGLLQRARELLGQASAMNKRVMLIFCDVNGLKAINDTLGHEMGDAVIVDTARILSSLVRGTDVVARLGGDEFVVLGMINQASGAEAFTARLNAATREFNRSSDRAYRVSVTAGITSWDPDAPKSLDRLLQDADAAMYATKRSRQRASVTASGELVVRAAASLPLCPPR